MCEVMKLQRLTAATIFKKCITNGIDNMYIPKDDPVPDGWRYGVTRKKK